MSDKVISYIDMCSREGVSLQRGMNFGLGGNHSVILMSVRPNAPYRDQVDASGTTLIYESHDLACAINGFLSTKTRPSMGASIPGYSGAMGQT